MSPPTHETCETTYRELITLRKQEYYYKNQMEDLRTSQKFLEELWNFASRVEEAVEGYKLVVCDYQLANRSPHSLMRPPSSTKRPSCMSERLKKPLMRSRKRNLLQKPKLLIQNATRLFSSHLRCSTMARSMSSANGRSASVRTTNRTTFKKTISQCSSYSLLPA